MSEVPRPREGNDKPPAPPSAEQGQVVSSGFQPERASDFQAAINKMVPYEGSMIPEREMDERGPEAIAKLYEDDPEITGRIVHVVDLSDASGDADPDSLFHVAAVVTTKKGSDGIVMPQELSEFRGKLVRGGKNVDGKDMPHARPKVDGDVVARMTDMTQVARDTLQESIAARDAEIAKASDEIDGEYEEITKAARDKAKQEELHKQEIAATPRENDPDSPILRDYQDGRVQGREILDSGSDDDGSTTYVEAVAEDKPPYFGNSLYKKPLSYTVSAVEQSIESIEDEETGATVFYISTDRKPLVVKSELTSLDAALTMGREKYEAGQQARKAEKDDTDARIPDVEKSLVASFGEEASAQHAEVERVQSEEERARLEAKRKDELRVARRYWKDGRTVHRREIDPDALGIPDTIEDSFDRYVEVYQKNQESTLNLVTVVPIEDVHPETGERYIHFHEIYSPLGTHTGGSIASATEVGLKRYKDLLDGKPLHDVSGIDAGDPGSDSSQSGEIL